MSEAAEVAIIGAGLIGSSLAAQLSKDLGSGLVVLDFDLEGTLSSSELNAGGVRGTWNQPINQRLAQSSIEYFEKVADQISFRQAGYCWFKTEEGMKGIESQAEKQIKAGWPAEIWSPSDVQNELPFVDKVEGLGGAFFSPRDGLINPNLLKLHFRKIAKDNGVRFVDRVMLRSAKVGAGKVELGFDAFEQSIDEDRKKEILSYSEDSAKNADQYNLTAQKVVNCAGAWAPRVAKMLGYDCPSTPVRRQISLFDAHDLDLSEFGMMVDTSGVYFHPEATHCLAGFANHDEPAGENFTYEGEEFFMEKIWAPLFERSSKFERLKHVTGWAGLYEVSPDESPIVGEVRSYPKTVFESHSYSGRGAMQCHTAAVELAELIMERNPRDLDIAPLNGERFSLGKELREDLII